MPEVARLGDTVWFDDTALSSQLMIVNRTNNTSLVSHSRTSVSKDALGTQTSRSDVTPHVCYIARSQDARLRSRRLCLCRPFGTANEMK